MSNASPPNKSPAVAVSAATGGRLVGVGGLFNNHEWLIQRTPFTFGRLSTSDVNLDHEVGASRSHAEIHADGSQYTILDKSSNGTIVNGTRIPKGIVQPLRHNDVITICNTSFKFKHEVGSGSADGLEEAPEPTSIFHMSSLPSAPLSAPLSAPPTIPPPSSKNDDAVFSLDAMDMMARAARAEAEATEAKARADREVARLRAEAEAAREESRRIRRSVEEANEAKARAEAEAKALLEAEMARQQAAFEAVRQKIEAEVRARAEAELARVRAEAEAAKQLVEAEIRARAEIEAKARAALEARAEVEAKARAVLEARSVADRQELERLRAESIRMSSVPARVATAPPRPAVPPTAVAPQPDPFAAVVARAAAGPGALASSGARGRHHSARGRHHAPRGRHAPGGRRRRAAVDTRRQRAVFAVGQSSAGDPADAGFVAHDSGERGLPLRTR
jgi:pSer/pThr/pTyr-binding forkhead associated (FHA) protein